MSSPAPTTYVLVPQLGEGLREVTLIAILKATGEAIRRDEALAVLESDKASITVESPEQGIVGEWRFDVGATIPIGQIMTSIEKS
jgi:2-oxoglutarate dehydrogenase E2 component (dihydrolipoamide succinyltransferase)